MRHRLASTAAAALLAVAAVVGVSADLARAQQGGPLPPGLGIRLLEAPEDRRDDPRARTTVVDHVAPGATFSRQLEATNGTDEPMEVRFYTRPASLESGAFTIDDDAEAPITEYVTITPAEATVPPGGRVQAIARFDVPASATEGEYYGVLLVERPGEPGAGGTVALAARAGIAVYLSVGEGGEPASDFSVTTLTASRSEEGAPVVTASVTNTGGRALSISGDLRLIDGPGGLSAGPFPAVLGTVLGVGETGPVRIELDKQLPNGPWLAQLTLRSGRIERAVEGTITFPEQAGAEAAPVKAKALSPAEDPKVLVPIAGGLIFLVALGMLGFFYRRRTRVRRRPKKDEPEQQQPEPAAV